MSATPFYDEEESEFYGMCVEDLIRRRQRSHGSAFGMVELGVGTAKTICGVLRRVGASIHVHGFEIDESSFRSARSNIRDHALEDRYRLTHGDFFEAMADLPARGCLISNPPYLPSPDPQIRLPHLWGGEHGDHISRRAIALGFPHVLLMLSSFANPLGLLRWARAHDYSLVHWVARPIEFGDYSSEPKVRRHIDELAAAGRSFVTEDSYLLVGATWSKEGPSADRSAELARLIRGHSVPRHSGSAPSARLTREGISAAVISDRRQDSPMVATDSE
ncbi:class I SAM-dependent methyltransferase [Glycomyces dulcitolivorans]|uniref:methyltransferase n=1 Tax=Glycomyces dulcitolivorans TaxID=2200759 RepID=UPI000DD38BD2|nr:methyltransferase [Glycomyces dulcitolivorans]